VAVRNASKRLPTPLGPSTRHAGTGLGEPIERDLSEIVAVEQIADESARARCHHNSVGFGDHLQTTRELRSFANNPMFDPRHRRGDRRPRRGPVAMPTRNRRGPALLQSSLETASRKVRPARTAHSMSCSRACGWPNKPVSQPREFPTAPPD